MRNKKQNRGFTLVELLVSVSIFSVFLVAIITLSINMFRDSRRIELQEQMYQDMRAMMRQITILVEDNAIDYEEYYRASLGDAEFAGTGGSYDYGDYAKLFYDLGDDLAEGALCNDGVNTPDTLPGCIIDKSTLDLNVGQNPANGAPELANAFCGGAGQPGCPVDNAQDHLYLINADGNRKTFLALEPIDRSGTIENTLSIFWANGSDTDGDDITDTWTEGTEFTGTFEYAAKDLVADKNELKVYDYFIPISPLRTNITSLKFYVAPLEDPYKGFAETTLASGTLVQPHVTVVLTAEPSVVELDDYFGRPPIKTLQTTIYSDIRKNVKSY
ncbi:type II secretion system protein J [Patescibacteria group bacterium]